MVIKNPFRRDEDQPFANLQRYALGASADQPQAQQPAPQAQQPAQYAQAATLAQPQAQQPQAQPQQPAPQPAAAPAPQVPPPVVPPAPQAQQFGQPQQPQPAQPRQTTMTPMTAAQRYNQMLQQNVPQAQAVSSGLAQVIENPTVAAQRGFDAAQKEFQDKIRSSGLERNADRTSALINKAANLKAGESLTPEEFAELQKISSTKQSFGGEGMRDTDFVALKNYVDALGQANQAKQLAGLATDQTGRQELLNKLVDNGQQYGTGQSLFDTLIAGGVQPAAQQLGDIKKQLVTEDLLGKAGTAAQQRASDVKNLEQSEVDTAYKDIQDFLDSKESGKLAAQEQAIRDRIAAENKKAQELNARIDSVLKNKGSKFGDNKAEQDLIAELGLSKNQVADIQAAGPNARADIINRLKEMNEQTATSKDELARLNQLYKIGDLVNRQGNKIQAKEGEDLGSLIGQKATTNRDALNQAMSENSKAVVAKKAEFNQAALQQPIKDYRFGGGTTTKNAAIDIYDRMRTGSFAPGVDNPEADKVIRNMKDAIQKTATAYSNAGLSFNTAQFEPTPKDVESTFKAMWENTPVARMPMSNKMLYNGDINQLKAKNPDLYNQMYSSALRMAQIKKLSEYMGFFNEFRHQKK